MGPVEEGDGAGGVYQQPLSTADRLDKTDKPLSSNEVAMEDLEQEILNLGEHFGTLVRKLKPVLDSASEKAATVNPPEQPSRPLVSPVAKAIGAKTAKLRLINYQIRSITNSIDL